MSKKTLVVGSIGFDLIFSIQPTFKEELPLVDGKIENVNMTFISTGDTKYLDGGTGSNIAYSHALLSKGDIVLFSAVGTDFKDSMGKKLTDLGVNDRTVVFPRETARSYQISDDNLEQMIIWQPNAYSHIGEIDLYETIDDIILMECTHAIFSPGTPISTLRHMKNYREINSQGLVIFDPGQMVNHYDTSTFTQCCRLANILILNETELLKVKAAFQLDEHAINEQFNTIIIITKGKDGSLILDKGELTEIPPYKINQKIKETTGAGDAYRGGLLAALLMDKSLEYACKVGSVLGAYSAIHNGPQEHKISWEETEKITNTLV